MALRLSRLTVTPARAPFDVVIGRAGLRVYAAMVMLGAGELVAGRGFTADEPLVWPAWALLGLSGGMAALSLGFGLGCVVLALLRRLPARVAALFAVFGLGGAAGLPFAFIAALGDPRWLVFPVAVGVVVTIALDINWRVRHPGSATRDLPASDRHRAG